MMCSRSAIKTLAAAALIGTTLGGCSENYLDRRDAVTLYSGEAMAANRVTQTIDPWSAASGHRRIAYSGEKAASASERYRTGRIIQPASALTSSTYGQTAQPQPNNQPAPPSSPSGSNSNGSTK